MSDIMHTLIHFYEDENNLSSFIDIIDGHTRLSLRVIDWFVTNYAKQNETYFLKDNMPYYIHKNYKQQLKLYSKKQFDPFCRRERIDFLIDNDKYIETTIGQLNFFRWAISSGVISFLTKEIHKVEQEMNKNSKKIRRRTPMLSIIEKNNVSIYMSFD